MVVCKFGGSSVADASQIKKVKAILESDEKRAVAVVSAPGKRNKEDEKITDLLYKCNGLVQQGQSCKPVFAKIQKRFLDIASELNIVTKELEEVLDEVRRNIDAGRGADYAASRGEYLSARLISQAMGWEFLDSESVIVINNDSTVNPSSYDNLKEAVKSGKRYIIPGFYGKSENGEIKTFTRGGSDITGAIVARALDAEIYENWTDVSGVKGADPRIVENAKVIEKMSYDEVRELSEVGASVFHEEAIAPVVPKKIPINIKNTNKPEDKGTFIVSSQEGTGLCGVSAKGGLSAIKLSKLMLFKKRGMRHALLTMLQVYGIRPCYSIFGIDSLTWYFDSNMASDSVCESMCERMKSEFELDSISVERGYAVMGVVGEDMDKRTDFIDALIALRSNDIEIASVSYGMSKVSALIGIKEEDKNKAVKAVYDALF